MKIHIIPVNYGVFYMWVEIILASVWGGIVATDTTAFLQIMVSRPMVACSIVGLILGNFQLGFTIGIILELLYISELPIGGANFAEGNVGATAAAAIGILTVRQIPEREYIIIVCALLLSAAISWLGGILVRFMRHINGKVVDVILKRKLITPMHVNLGQLVGIMLAFFLGFLSLFVSCFVFINLLPLLIHQAPLKLDVIFRPIIGGLLAVGCVYLIHIFWAQGERRRLFAIGVCLGALWILIGI